MGDELQQEEQHGSSVNNRTYGCPNIKKSLLCLSDNSLKTGEGGMPLYFVGQIFGNFCEQQGIWMFVCFHYESYKVSSNTVCMVTGADPA